MLLLLSIGTILASLMATMIVYQAFGPRRSTLTFTRAEKHSWDGLVKERFGTWLTIANIFGSLTSIATVYVFFIGNVNKFGFWIFASIVTIFFGSLITNRFTRLVVSNPSVLRRLSRDDQSSAVMLSIFADGTTHGSRTAQIVKFITITNITALLWLEFSVFADVTSRLVAPDMEIWGSAILFVSAFTIISFTLRYGLRGFVLADLFQSPIIAVGAFVLMGGACYYVITRFILPLDPQDVTSVLVALYRKTASVLGTPVLGVTSGILFSISCLFLNGFLVLVTQPHWLRMWLFGGKEVRFQIWSLGITSAIWSLLILVGGLAAIIVSQEGLAGSLQANEVVVVLLRTLAYQVSPVFLVTFWLAGMAALFSSADVQIYSFLLMRRFNCVKGKLEDSEFARLRIWSYSFFPAAGFSVAYWLVRHFHLPLDRLVLILVPSCITMVPSLILVTLRRRQNYWLIIASASLYTLCAIVGLAENPLGQAFAVAAPICPFVVSLGALLCRREDDVHAGPE